ncbi:hypothetical protein [Planococcus faecalis]|uniref:hypothetical protein n=1 Tax=Planococcus faecalis TaxID=1598147 RepID=UPI0034E9494E
MNIIVTLVFMAIVGALIGGVTNHLAIKMLFWPYEAKYIGKWRVPLTPDSFRNDAMNYLVNWVEQLLSIC